MGNTVYIVKYGLCVGAGLGSATAAFIGDDNMKEEDGIEILETARKRLYEDMKEKYGDEKVSTTVTIIGTFKVDGVLSLELKEKTSCRE
jgi:hypothetical protein